VQCSNYKRKSAGTPSPPTRTVTTLTKLEHNQTYCQRFIQSAPFFLQETGVQCSNYKRKSAGTPSPPTCTVAALTKLEHNQTYIITCSQSTTPSIELLTKRFHSVLRVMKTTPLITTKPDVKDFYHASRNSSKQQNAAVIQNFIVSFGLPACYGTNPQSKVAFETSKKDILN